MARLKRLVPLLLTALALLTCLHLSFHRVQFREIARAPNGAGQPPAQPGHTFSYPTAGTYPGFSDRPVSWEEGKAGRDFFRLLGEYTYAPVPLLRPRARGVAAYTITGCTPEYTAYWDGLLLWLPVLRQEQLVWRGYLPSSPGELGAKLQALWERENGS